MSGLQDMNSAGMTLATVSLFNVINKRCCPQCGGPMREAERHKEGSTTYVWFECIRAGCDGQWLQPYVSLLSKQSEHALA